MVHLQLHHMWPDENEKRVRVNFFDIYYNIKYRILCNAKNVFFL